ncbi:MAG: B12-binding domain-containing radical SAM protein [Planctomycetes bacterium]|nr:B12-binding domain-containing radical SAM protein [Planctomycetota bacterium]
MKILLVAPATPHTFWSFAHALPFVSRQAAFPPLGLITVAAMLPPEWEVALVDLNVAPLTDERIDWADYVFLTGMIVHADSAQEVLDRCGARGRTVIAGGPLFTTGRDRFPALRHVVLGEAEEVMPALVADMRAGTVRETYQAPGRPDLETTPVPRWNLLNLRAYASVSVQFSRGCPFNCEFCDIIVMNGRVPRVKTPERMLAELDALLAAGWRGSIFIVDDNFIGNKARVKELLRELIAWRARSGFRYGFTTEASLNVADDAELVDLMVRAGFKRVFVGIESPDPAVLEGASKTQNAHRDLAADVRRLQNAGLEVMGGFILGFDGDREGVFERQRRFIQETGVVTAMVGLLTALPGTRLFSRLLGEGRILSHSTGNNLDGVLNFIPRLDRETLLAGYRSLVRHLYAPRTYYRRATAFLREYRPSGPPVRLSARDVAAFLKSLWVLGVRHRGRREYWKFLTASFLFRRRAFAEAVTLAISGHHFRRVAAAL